MCVRHRNVEVRNSFGNDVLVLFGAAFVARVLFFFPIAFLPVIVSRIQLDQLYTRARHAMAAFGKGSGSVLPPVMSHELGDPSKVEEGHWHGHGPWPCTMHESP